jgi:type I restriction enzyme S subunit
VVPTEAIRGRRIDHSVLPKITEAKARELERHGLRPGDILFARRGVQATGHVGCVRDGEDGFICGTGAIRLRVTRASSEIDPDYLSHVLADPSSVEWFKFHAIGATMPNLNEGIIRSFRLSVPPFPEQRAIAHILGTLDDKIELNRRMNETLVARARALSMSWFVDFDPVRAKAEGRDPGLPKPLADLFPARLVASELGEVPEGWAVVCVDDEFDLTMGQSPPGESYNELGEGMPFYQGRADFQSRFPRRRVFCTAPTRLAKAGDTLISVRAPVGDINMAGEDCAIGRGVAAARHRTSSRSYTYQFMRGLEAVFARFEAEGTVFGSISKTDFHAIPCIAPPALVVSSFETMLLPLDNRIEVSAVESSTLAALRDSLLPKLISGELRVKDAGKIIEGIT